MLSSYRRGRSNCCLLEEPDAGSEGNNDLPTTTRVSGSLPSSWLICTPCHASRDADAPVRRIRTRFLSPVLDAMDGPESASSPESDQGEQAGPEGLPHPKGKMAK